MCFGAISFNNLLFILSAGFQQATYLGASDLFDLMADIGVCVFVSLHVLCESVGAFLCVCVLAGGVVLAQRSSALVCHFCLNR